MIRYEKDGTVGLLTLDAPPSNSLATPLFADPGELESFMSDPEIKGVVVRGGGRHFCGGADRDALAVSMKDPASLARGLSGGKALLDLLSFATVPVVASIRGQCLGGGLEIALACHFRIAASSAMFGFPETTIGLMPGMGGTVSDAVGRRVLVDMALSGRMVGAEEALEIGLVDRVAPPREVEDAARERIDELVGQRPARVVRAVMESINNGRRMDRDAALERETELFVSLVEGAS